MLKSLRKKFILIAMSSMTIVLIVLMTIVNLANYININRTADTLLSILAENRGSFPKEHGDGFSNSHSLYYYREKYDISPEAAYNTRYFTVTLTEDGTIKSINTGRVSITSSSNASEIATTLWKKNSDKGFWDIYKYRLIELPSRPPKDLPPEFMYIFLDCDQELKTFRTFLFSTIFVSILGLLVVFLLIYIFSGKTLKPVADSYEKQKRFITDASHDIKTPLTIIDANTEILEMTGGENEWTRSIRNQISRLTDLTEKMVFLTRMDEEGSSLTMFDFSLSDAVYETAEPFLAIAQTKNAAFTLDVEPDISFYGAEDKIRQLVSLLTDNACKYVSESGEIKLWLYRSGKNNILTVYNTVDEIEKGSQNILFDRFYRRDASRSQTIAGHGIGLSVAQAIVLAHKGKISAKSDDGSSILFTVTL